MPLFKKTDIFTIYSQEWIARLAVYAIAGDRASPRPLNVHNQ